MANPRVSYRLNHPKDKTGNLKSELCPILVEFYCKLFRMEISTGLKCYPANWIHQRATSKEKGFKEINTTLSRIETEMLEVWASAKRLPVNEIKSLLKGVVREDIRPIEEKKTVVQAVRQFIAQYEAEKDKATLSKYKALLKRIEGFEAGSGMVAAPLLFENLDYNFYDSFKKFLYSLPNPNYRGWGILNDSAAGVYILQHPDNCHSTDLGWSVGLFDDVVFKYFTNLKTICAWAEKRGFQVNPAYKAWEIIKREYSPISLTIDELRSIEFLTITAATVRHLVDEKATNPEREAERKAQTLNIARDYFSLECRTGQRISDLRRFHKDNIHGNTWVFNQKKGSRLTTKTISLPLIGYCAPALLLLQKHNYVLPKISEQNLNYGIKELCKLAGINQPMFIERWAGNKKIRIPGKKYEFISTHTGRKTFITIALQHMQPKVVMDITGIRSFKTLRHYMGDSEIGTIEAGLRNIEDGISLMRKHG